jgi:anaerobic magnesium-protoporphyrin IX monomethyl ester cyclase
VVSSGDYEPGVARLLRSVEEPLSERAGILLRRDGPELPSDPGVLLSPEDWILPSVGDIPYEAYERLYLDDDRKYCGIPDRRELVVPVARGCPVGCSFCDVPVQQGQRDRRISVTRTIEYIESRRTTHSFEYVSFYAPTFTLRRAWVEELCRELAARVQLPWKCATTLHHLDEPLIARMASAGCIRISVGIETFGAAAASKLPLLKRDGVERFRRVAQACAAAGVELNCFVIVGLPGDTPATVEGTMRMLLDHGARVRPVAYAPYHLLRDDMSEDEVSLLNRQLLPTTGSDAETRARYYELLYANQRDRATQVQARIPRVARAAGAR